jgi:hypothetical protein
MREIKFRFWGTKEKKMFDDADVFVGDLLEMLDYETEGKNCPYIGVNTAMGLAIENGYIPREFTGLKDKNGKEIYEGDIIGVPYVSPIGQVDDKYDPNEIFPVVFEHGEFALKRPGDNQPLKEWIKFKRGEYIPNYGNPKIYTDEFIGEVIGNIYENKELLGVKE